MPRRDTYTLAQAAEYCDTTLHVIRKRADRGSLPTFKDEHGVRHVTHQALEDASLVPDSELLELRREVASLREEISVHRRLVASTKAEADAERAGREHIVSELVEQRALAQAAQARALELEQLERDLAEAGPIKAWRLARQQRKQSATP